MEAQASSKIRNFESSSRKVEAFRLYFYQKLSAFYGSRSFVKNRSATFLNSEFNSKNLFKESEASMQNLQFPLTIPGLLPGFDDFSRFRFPPLLLNGILCYISRCSIVLHKVESILLLKLNITLRLVENQYHKGKLKSFLKR